METQMHRPSAKEVLKLRKNYSMTQAACAEALDVTVRQWRRYEGPEKVQLSGPMWIFFKNRQLWPKS